MPSASSPGARERLLHLLKTKGPATASSLARRLSVTPTAVRQHLAPMEAEGVVAHVDVPGKVGRPKRTWRTTPAADAWFPNSHAELAVGLVASVSAAFGPKGLEKVIAERTRLQVAEYRGRLPSRDRPLAERVAALARIRRDEGYLAEVERDEDGTLLLVENHCPICVAARACTGLCAGELELFRDALGPGVAVERTEHLLAGARRCAYRIAPRGRPPRSPSNA